MILTYLMLIVALCLSAVAAFYSIVGLAAIFASAVVPIIIMGSILEVAKLVVTVWLHEYWQKCKLTMKLYLVPAVFILMVITSMGIFGFLSKAHLDQAVISGDSTTKIAIYDEKIRSARENIETNRRALRQMDEAVEQQMSRSSDEQGAQRAASLRRTQQNERNRLQGEIAKEQIKIQQLNEERVPIAAAVRKVEAEVGPIKYIAALIYGDNPDANLLEKAVRWVIIILVMVFDPLAIMMLLAFTESLRWEHDRRRPAIEQSSPEQPVNDAVGSTRIWAEDLWQRFRSRPNATVPDDATVTKDLDGHPPGNNLVNEPMVAMVDQLPSIPAQRSEPEPELNQSVQHTDQTVVDNTTEQKKIEYRVLEDSDDEVPVTDVSRPIETARPGGYLDRDQDQDDDEDDKDDHAMKIAKKLWKTDHPSATLKEQRRLYALGHIDRLPWIDYLPGHASDIGHGAKFPGDAKKGDVWIRTDSLPTALYKFNGDRWILIDKNMSDRYSYEQSYIDFLIDQVSRGLYDPELLTDAERSQIEIRLRKDLE